MGEDLVAQWEGQLQEALLGKRLTSAEFVLDYVQLRFDGPFLTVITWPVLEVDGERFRWGERGFRDALCSPIGKEVIRAEIRAEHSLQLEFSDGAVFRVSLKDEDYRSAEAVRFQDDDAEWWVL